MSNNVYLQKVMDIEKLNLREGFITCSGASPKHLKIRVP
jgi:hypothetical protein